MVVVEVRQRTLWIAGRSWTRRTRRTTRRRRGDEEERRGEEEQATDIKSNNPHLAGGEKHGGLIHTPDPFWSWSRGQKSPGDGLQLGFSSPAITSWV